MSNNPLTEDELRQWVLSLPPDSIRSLEDTLKSIRNCHFQSDELNTAENNVNTIESLDDIDVSPPSRTMSPTSSNASVQSRSKSGKTYENGRRNLKEEDVSTEEANRRAKRRERNRLAAAKCRKRRQDKIETLQHRVNQLKSQMVDLNGNIDQYNCEQERLDGILSSHKCTLHGPSAPPPRPKDLKIEQSQDLPTACNNVFICSLSPQLINLSPLFTPSTMKLLLDSISSQHSDVKEETLLQTSVESTIFTAISSPASTFSQSLSLLNLMSPNPDLLNMDIYSSSSLQMAASLASLISSPSVKVSSSISSAVPSTLQFQDQYHQHTDLS